MQMQRLLLGLFICAVAATVAFADSEQAADAFQALEKEFKQKLSQYKTLKERQEIVEASTKKFLPMPASTRRTSPPSTPTVGCCASTPNRATTKTPRIGRPTPPSSN